MSPLDHLHPATVHFPIALLLLGSVLALVKLYRPPPVDIRVTIWLLIGLGWLAAGAAILTGLLAQSRLPPDAPYAAVLNGHIGAGIAVVVVYGFLLYWGWIYRSPRAHGKHAETGRDDADLLDDPNARLWITLLLVVGIILIFVSGWNGGALVYEWGVNVAS